MQGRVTVLGVNGRIGQEVARAFVAAGWRTIGMGRSDKVKIPGVRFVAGDALRPADIARASAGADVVINALNLAYDKWDKGRYEALTQSVIEGLKGSGKTIIFAGNIYNYSARDHLLTPETPHRPEKDKGQIRERIEAMMAAAAERGDFRLIILRAPDFYGPGATGTMFDLAMLSRLKSGVIQYPGPLDLGHSWGYLPDLARVYVVLAERAETFGPVAEFLYSGHYATGREMVAAIQAALPMKTRVTGVPWGLMRVIGLFVPVVREVIKMNYLWHTPHRLEDDRLKAILGPDFGTPFAEAVAKTTRSYLPAVDGQTASRPAAAK